MMIHQSTQKIQSQHDQRAIMIDKIRKIAEADQTGVSDIENLLVELENESSEARNSNAVLCNITEDPIMLQIIASFLYSQLRLKDLNEQINRTTRRYRNKYEEFKFQVWDRFGLYDGAPFHIDYSRWCIVKGFSSSDRKIIEDKIRNAKKLISCTEDQISIIQSHIDEFGPFEKDLISLLSGPDRNEVRAICEKLFTMNNSELSRFKKTEERAPIYHLAEMLYDFSIEEQSVCPSGGE